MIRLENISKIYTPDDIPVYALDDISLTVGDGDFVAVIGASGSGKTTLLNIIGCMDIPTKGSYMLDDINVSGLRQRQLCKLRNMKLSFVFQSFALMEKYTGYENIELPLLIRKTPLRERRTKVYEIADKLGIENQLNKLPRQMSGGQQQRVALARALVSGADIILADEPTGALDKKNGTELMEILKELNGNGKTVILVTHDLAVAKYAKRTVTISDGRIVE